MPDGSAKPKCKSLVKRCRACGWSSGYEKRREVCPGCGADMRCGRAPVAGYAVCQAHGGPAPHKNFYGKGTLVTGSGSQFPLMRLAATYNKMMHDGRVLSNRSSIEMVRKRIAQLAERIDMNEAPDRLAKLNELWEEWKTLKGKSNEQYAVEIELDAEFEKAYHDYAAWKQMFEALDLDRKMVESEVKVLKEIKAIITAEDAYELSAKLLAAVMRVIDDPKKLKQVQYEFTRLIGESGDNIIERPGAVDWGGGDEEDNEPGSSEMDRAELLHTGDEG